VRWIGRAAPSGQASGALGKFAWSGSGFAATLTGSKISVSLQTEGSTSSAFLQPVVDGTAGTRFQVMTGAPQTVVLGTGLSPGPHTVEVYRESEGMYGDDILLGFPDGTLGVPPPGKQRLIEIVGDSISAGYGNLGSETHPPWTNTCTFSLDTEAAYQSYGAILGRSLDAEVSIIARSGWGLYRDLNNDTSNVVPSVYANTLGTQASPAWSFAPQPDAVIVNLGTNDSAMGDPGQPFEDAYVAFLRTVRSRYPSAWIFLTIGPMTADPPLSAMRTHLDDVAATLGDPRVTTVDVAEQNTATTGCDYHPNVAEDQAMAATLATAIKSRLSW
jgi:lysophospholipase L1-like esterase